MLARARATTCPAVTFWYLAHAPAGCVSARPTATRRMGVEYKVFWFCLDSTRVDLLLFRTSFVPTDHAVKHNIVSYPALDS
ncbi:hypothetical protein EVAR_12318_1 [Eumeta japonica]|uniref:Uncharacterized protein n=1 Tax=Eumeta variegata TaxID=151549 RepID=A0A4C1TUP4_EUMVA|nr:hypothetical protein EVAR_12318_1 [Eumeta japonica]